MAKSPRIPHDFLGRPTFLNYGIHPRLFKILKNSKVFSSLSGRQLTPNFCQQMKLDMCRHDITYGTTSLMDTLVPWILLHQILLKQSPFKANLNLNITSPNPEAPNPGNPPTNHNLCPLNPKPYTEPRPLNLQNTESQHWPPRKSACKIVSPSSEAMATATPTWLHQNPGLRRVVASGARTRI